MNLRNDSILHYDVNEFGKAGYAVPNWSNDVGSVNPTIRIFAEFVGMNLFGLMHHEDVHMKTPPSINTIKRIHQLYVRMRQFLGGRSVLDDEERMEVNHTSPAIEVFRAYPVPYLYVRNPLMRQLAYWGMTTLSEAFQHTENRQSIEITPRFSHAVGSPFRRVYQIMAMEYFGVSRDIAKAPEFLLTTEQLNAYAPSQWFTEMEWVDTVARFDHIFTEDRTAVLAAGIPVTQLPQLKPFPTDLQAYYEHANQNLADPSTFGINPTDATIVDVGTGADVPPIA